MNKKVWLLVFMFMLVIDVKALSFKGGDVIKNVFVLKVKENLLVNTRLLEKN